MSDSPPTDRILRQFRQHVDAPHVLKLYSRTLSLQTSAQQGGNSESPKKKPWATETPAVNRQLGSGRDIASASSTRPRHPAHVLSCAMDACLRNETEIFEQAVVATINVPIPNDVRSPVQTICDQFVVLGLDFHFRLIRFRDTTCCYISISNSTS